MISRLWARRRAPRRLFVAPLALTVAACATYYDDPAHYQTGEVSSAGAAGHAGSDATGVAGAGGMTSGGFGGVPAGASAGGAAPGGGETGGASSGAAGASGMPAAGAESGGGGAGGAGGGGAGGAGGGGKPTGGAGGSVAGSAGTGGSAPAHPCDEHPITSKSKWLITASNSETPTSPARAVDGDVATRWTTGKEQMGGEWLQIDFGATVTLTQLTLVLGASANDYPRSYTTRFSSSSQNTGAPVLLSGAGVANSDTVMKFLRPTSGRYLLITQGGVAPSLWWSVAELQAQCVD